MKLYILPIILTLALAPLPIAMLDSGKPAVRNYTVEQIAPYLGKRVYIQFEADYGISSLTVQIKGIMKSSLDKKTIVIIGITEFKNKISIPIKDVVSIQIMEEI